MTDTPKIEDAREKGDHFNPSDWLSSPELDNQVIEIVGPNGRIRHRLHLRPRKLQRPR